MTTEQPASLIRPIKCRKCRGTGTWQMASGPATCSRCFGRGEEEGDKATNAALDRLNKDVGDLARAAAAWDAEDRPNRQALTGLALLEQRDPERYRRAVESFAAGRNDVLPALDAYSRA